MDPRPREAERVDGLVHDRLRGVEGQRDAVDVGRATHIYGLRSEGLGIRESVFSAMYLRERVAQLGLANDLRECVYACRQVEVVVGDEGLEGRVAVDGQRRVGLGAAGHLG